MMDKGGGVVDDMGEVMQCSDHPYRNNPGGICAFCLQEKLGRLVSSSKSNPSFPIHPSSSSSSPSFRSDGGLGIGLGLNLVGATSSSSLSLPPSSSSNSNNFHYPAARTRIPFLLAQKKTKKVVASSDVNNFVLQRSKSSAAPRRPHHFDADTDEYSPRKRGFWSFLHRRRSSRDRDRDSRPSVHPTTSGQPAKDKGSGESSSSRRGDYGDENESPNSSHASSSSFGRKVARSRSVGCGSRSFSGDFLERISTGFGDCTLRRVESQREAKQAPKVVLRGGDDHHRIKERVKCGGIFGGFSMTSSSSSSSSYWISSSTASEDVNNNGRVGGGGPVPHGRSKSWAWAFASPMRAFRPSSKLDDKDVSSVSGKRDIFPHNNSANSATTAPNLAAIPSLLTVRS